MHPKAKQNEKNEKTKQVDFERTWIGAPASFEQRHGALGQTRNRWNVSWGEVSKDAHDLK